MSEVAKDPPLEKTCSQCSTKKTIENFYRDKNKPDGYLNYCKACHKKASDAREVKKSEKTEDTPKELGEKICNKCCVKKTLDNFHKDKTKSDGYNNNCKKCRSTKKEEPDEPVEKEEIKDKICSKCKVTKTVDNFYKRGDGYRAECKACRPNYDYSHKKERDLEQEYTCTTCKIVKKGSEFNKTIETICKECCGKRMYENRKKLDGALRDLVNNARGRCKDKQGEKYMFDITYEEIKDMYEKQDGICYYSGIEMTTDGSWKISLERLDNSKGYIKDNVALCCLEFNNQLHWSKDKINEILEILDKNITDNTMDFSKKTTKVYSDTPYDKNDYYNSPRGKIVALVNSAKHRSIKKTNAGRNMDFDLDADFLIDLFNKQKGLCAYSNIPLQFGKSTDSDWIVSLERIDVTKGYTKDNVCLICLEFNSTDRTINQNFKSETSTGWSKSKFEYFKTIAHANL